jgi:hypothetical protein
MSSKPLPLLPYQLALVSQGRRLSRALLQRIMDDDSSSGFSSNVPSNEHTNGTGNGHNTGRELAAQDKGTQYHKDHILQELAEKQFPPEDSELIVKAFEKSYVGHARATYYDGIRIQEASDGAIREKAEVSSSTRRRVH